MQGEEKVAALLRRLPQVQRLLEAPDAEALVADYTRGVVADALRDALGRLRAELREGAVSDVPDAEALIAEARLHLAGRGQPALRRVINATGIVLHTNLGRAPLAAAAIRAVAEAAGGYCNLELDLETGGRGGRGGAVETLLAALTGAEAALAVNNGAAAILLALAGLAGSGEVIVSRGELVEIGGGFRIPDVIRQGGARLVEVGSTNRTRLADYRDAVTAETRVLLKVHQSNFRMIGFTSETGIGALAGLARERGLLVVADLGSGVLTRLPLPGGGTEPTVRAALAAGADLVTFSGDKLLGGPQAGLLVGRREAVEQLRRHPLLRALRLDKMSLAALEATLILHRDAPAQVPVLRILGQSEDALQARAERLCAALGGAAAIERTSGFAGGGALPEERIASRGVSLQLAGVSPEALSHRLRTGRPAIVGRIAEGRFVMDVLAVADPEIEEIARAVAMVRAG